MRHGSRQEPALNGKTREPPGDDAGHEHQEKVQPPRVCIGEPGRELRRHNDQRGEAHQTGGDDVALSALARGNEIVKLRSPSVSFAPRSLRRGVQASLALLRLATATLRLSHAPPRYAQTSFRNGADAASS